MTVDFWFEFASPYSYPAAMRIERLATQRKLAVRWHAFLLGPIFKAQGWQDSPFNQIPAKGRYMWRDMERLCSHYQLPFQRPSRFPCNSRLATRVACWNSGAPWLPEYVRAIYQANFSQDLNIADPEVIAACLGQAGQVAGPILEQADSMESKAKLHQLNQQVVRQGIFGAPFILAGQEPFWGQDRLEQALDYAQACSPPVLKQANGQLNEVR
ncbi:2-hydroxychromene-2-carboxylate isomerase [Bowmanella dokdonensis]|uniref:2-hydroxychromene-2-carboxylate isomerase n=1 Tax=Bowmanella dokdonensis TaxID=751969 RepID=A0A939IRP0_9ALTE|nr:2-hydroxychromene-2-carboxylate isomerase [Bowmanella dokdonensis]MBN7826289.1 2-hydroxychromene-2-carboxylate isomerase [Bowmanella dokdonensis]